jgi:hypothetical protein
MKQNEFLSAGALLFYALVGLVLLSFGVVLNAIHTTRRRAAQTTAENDHNQELFNAKAQLADAKNELQRRDARIAEEEARRREAASLLSKAPKLWVDYKSGNSDPAGFETLIFSKEGDAAIRTIQPGPLMWIITETRPIDLHSVIGPLRVQPIECKFTASERIGNRETIYELPDLFRQMMRKLGDQAQPSVEILYEDFDGNRFSRTFRLAIDPSDRIVWHPGPVQLATRPDAA